jgi:hypothetical protein
MNFIKKYAVAIASAVAGVGMAVAGLCSAASTYITLPTTAVADLTGYTGGLFTDLWVVIALVIGIPLAFYVIRKVISLVRMH